METGDTRVALVAATGAAGEEVAAVTRATATPAGPGDAITVLKGGTAEVVRGTATAAVRRGPTAAVREEARWTRATSAGTAYPWTC